MRTLARLTIFLCCVLAALLPLVLWNATGRAGFTRLFDPARAQRDAQAAKESIADLFEGTGVTDGAKSMQGAPNSFALGLLPGGGPTDPRIASVATISGPATLAALLSLCSLLFGRKNSPRRREDAK